MNETRRTLTYVGVAVVLMIGAWWLSPPVEITPTELKNAKIGEEFYPKFTDPNEPTSIRVVAFDEAKAMHKTFGVSFENGKWTIPSHHNYPADGADRLAKTASSVMHIKREEIALGGDNEQNYEKLGVVDPLDEDKGKLKGRGQRITLSRGEDTILDLIIGKQLKDRQGYYYIRKVGDPTTYVAKLSIDLSTKFGDWIETDLLKLNRDELKEVVVNNYSIDEARGRLIEGEVSKLTRDKTADPWKLDGLDESKEELDVSKVNSLVSTLDDLKLVGVRPKPKGFLPDLSLDREYVKRQSDLQRLALDLQARGYILFQNKSGQFQLYSNEGELVAATNKGVVYTLKFGEVFSGDESDIEVGKTETEGESDADKKNKEEKEADKADAASKQPSRYLFVTTQFDERFLGEPPVAPEKPEGLPDDDEDQDDGPQINPKKSKGPAKSKPPQEPEADDSGDDGEPPAKSSGRKQKGDKDETVPPGKSEEECSPPGAADDDEPADKGDGSDKKDAEDDADDDAPKKEPAKKDGEKTSEAKEKEKSPEEIKKDYQAKLRKYKADLKSYEEKVEAGKKQVDELNKRFADWYYVIPAESFKKLHFSRSEIVKEKNKAAADKDKGDKDAGKARDPFPGEPKDPGDSKDDPDDEADDADAKKSPPADDSKAESDKPAGTEKEPAKQPGPEKEPAKEPAKQPAKTPAKSPVKKNDKPAGK
jgi:hypothetical protein